MFTDKELRAEIDKARKTRKVKKLNRDGVCWLILPTGKARASRRTCVDGHERPVALGTYPNISLAEARAGAAAAKEARRNGLDPAAEKQKAKLALRKAVGTTFAEVGREWLDRYTANVTKGTADDTLRCCKNVLFKSLGTRPINEITAPEVLMALRKEEARGCYVGAQRAKQHASKIFRFGIASGLCERDPAADVTDALAPVPPERHHASLAPKALPAFMKALRGHTAAHPGTLNALRLLMLTAIRVSELTGARWEEFDDTTWTIPAERMKARQAHVVALSRQALSLLEAQRLLSGSNPAGLVFPGQRSARRPLSQHAVLNLVYALGYRDKATSHGMRATFSTAANESGHFRPDVIEAALAHAEPSAVRAAYNRRQLLDERARLMQWWGDFISAAESDNVVPLRKKSA